MAKRHGISEQTIYNWRRHFGSMDTTDVKKLRVLEHENARLKKMLADRDLEIDAMIIMEMLNAIEAKKLVEPANGKEPGRAADARATIRYAVADEARGTLRFNTGRREITAEFASSC